MSSLTLNYGLYKPDENSDYIDIDKFNANYDIIDAKIKELNDLADQISKNTCGFLAKAITTGPSTNTAPFDGNATVAIPHDGKRHYRILTQVATRASAGSGGHLLQFMRSDNGGAFSGQSHGHAYGNSVRVTNWHHIMFEFADLATPAVAGTVAYRPRVSAHVTANNEWRDLVIWVFDAGDR